MTPTLVTGIRVPTKAEQAARAKLNDIINEGWGAIVLAIGAGSNPRQTYEMAMRRAANHAHSAALALRAKPKAKR